MDNARLEYWVHEVLDRVLRSAPIEDSRVELKRQWIDPDKAARRIAGHANACRGEQVLWIVGVDEESGVVGASHTEFSNWHSQVLSRFDGIAPSVQDLVVDHSGQTVVALCFDTSRAPFVTKNPMYNTPGGGPISFEIPWREGTAVRSARREDIIRLLVPLQTIPTVELLDGRIVLIRNPEASPPIFRAQLTAYLVPQREDQIVAPVHKFITSFRFNKVDDSWIPRHVRFVASPGSVTLSASDTELVIRGPGLCTIDFRFSMDNVPQNPLTSATAEIHWGFAGIDKTIAVSCQFAPVRENELGLSSSTVSSPG